MKKQEEMASHCAKKCLNRILGKEFLHSHWNRLSRAKLLALAVFKMCMDVLVEYVFWSWVNSWTRS